MYFLRPWLYCLCSGGPEFSSNGACPGRGARSSSVSWGFFVGIWQLSPLSGDWLDRLAPATADLDAQLLPAVSDMPAVGEAAAKPVLPPPGSTISLYPEGTRTELVRLLAVLLLFLVVRQNMGSAASLRRLAFVSLLNGTFLALFALVQFFTSRPDVLYWRFPAETVVFGPFICRNHFPFYLNLCIGLGVGLLLSFRTSRRQRRQSREAPDSSRIRARFGSPGASS